MQLSEQFSLGELTKSHTAERKGIENVPTEQEQQSLALVCENILEPVRAHYEMPIIPSSGYRALELNREIGSKDTSQHVKGEAVDYEIAGVPNMDLAKWIMKNLDYDQLILEFYKTEDPNSGWVHCSYVKEKNRKIALRFGGGKWEKLEDSST